MVVDPNVISNRSNDLSNERSERSDSRGENRREEEILEPSEIYYLDELGPIYQYCWVDAQDYLQKWYEAQIMEIKDNGKKIKIHYKGWKSKFDEWIDLDNHIERIKTLHACTKKGEMYNNNLDLSINSHVDALDSTDKWYEGEIVNKNKYLLKIHYIQWDDRYDEWINIDSYRIAPLHTFTKPLNKDDNSPQSQQPNVQSQLPSSSSPSSRSSIQNMPRRRSSRTNNTHDTSRQPQHIYNPAPNEWDSNNMKVPEQQNANPITDSELDDTDHEQENQQQQQQSSTSVNEQQIPIDKNNKNQSNYRPSIQNELDFRNLIEHKGLKIIDMGEDGNCLFRSISHQIYGTEDYHNIIRKKCVEYLLSESAYFRNFVPGDQSSFEKYCEYMKQNSVWGGNIEIQAFSEMYGRKIEIYAYSDVPMITFSNEDKYVNNVQSPRRDPNRRQNTVIKLSYHFSSHYNSIVNPLTHQQNIETRKIGEIEDEKIRLSFLRSSHALESTTNVSDIEATDLQYFNLALEESRKAFQERRNFDQKEFDEIIQKSLAEYNQNNLEKAIQMSLQDLPNNGIDENVQLDKMEQEDYKQAIALSLNNPKVDPLIQHLVIQNEDMQDTWEKPIKEIVQRGFTLEEATEAYSIYESSRNTISEEKLIDRMHEYLLSKKQPFVFVNSFG